ncbi:MAG: hypothetical protein AAB873_02185 [Patescibacteria group bacterium]
MEFKIDRSGKESGRIVMEDVIQDILDVVNKGEPEDFVDLVKEYKESGVEIDINDIDIKRAIVEAIQKRKDQNILDRVHYLQYLSGWKKAGLDAGIINKLIHNKLVIVI